MRRVLKSKIHRAKVTDAQIDYDGSLSIDRDLMDAADIVPFEEVHVWNVTSGTRLTTYAIEAPRGSGVVCALGAAAHSIRPEDVVIIATFSDMRDVPADYAPTIVTVDEDNRPRR